MINIVIFGAPGAKDGSGEIAETNGRICKTLEMVMNLKAKR